MTHYTSSRLATAPSPFLDIKTMNAIVKILMERDNMSQEDAEGLLAEAKEVAQNYIDNGGSFKSLENVLKDYFRLEPDYIFDLVDL